jgi:hypothetical protein
MKKKCFRRGNNMNNKIIVWSMMLATMFFMTSCGDDDDNSTDERPLPEYYAVEKYCYYDISLNGHEEQAYKYKGVDGNNVPLLTHTYLGIDGTRYNYGWIKTFTQPDSLKSYSVCLVIINANVGEYSISSGYTWDAPFCEVDQFAIESHDKSNHRLAIYIPKASAPVKFYIDKSKRYDMIDTSGDSCPEFFIKARISGTVYNTKDENDSITIKGEFASI